MGSLIPPHFSVPGVKACAAGAPLGRLLWIVHPKGLSLGKAGTGRFSRVFPGKTHPRVIPIIPRPTEKSWMRMGILHLPCWQWQFSGGGHAGCPTMPFWGTLAGEPGRTMVPMELGDVSGGWAGRSRECHTEREHGVAPLPF